MSLGVYRVPGPCAITWNSVSVGYTKAGVIIRPNTGLIPIIDDEHGTEPADFIRSGKSCVVDIIFNDAAAAGGIDNANPWIGDIIMSNMVGTLTQVGKMTNNFDGTAGHQLGKTLLIQEATPSGGVASDYQWIADYAMPLDPQQLLLSSTQEFLLPVTFLIGMNASGKLFSTIPTYFNTRT